MIINLTQDMLQEMLNFALNTGCQKAIYNINTIISSLPGVAHITGFDAAGVPSYTTPTPAQAATASSNLLLKPQPCRLMHVTTMRSTHQMGTTDSRRATSPSVTTSSSTSTTLRPDARSTQRSPSLTKEPPTHGVATISPSMRQTSSMAPTQWQSSLPLQTSTSVTHTLRNLLARQSSRQYQNNVKPSKHSLSASTSSLWLPR